MKRRHLLATTGVLLSGCLTETESEPQSKWSLPACSSSDKPIKVINAGMKTAETMISQVSDDVEGIDRDTEYKATVSGSLRNTKPRETVVEVQATLYKSGTEETTVTGETGAPVPSGETSQFELTAKTPREPDSFELSISSKKVDSLGMQVSETESVGCYID